MKEKINNWTKIYFQRLKDNCSMKTYGLWWIFRLGMIVLIVQSFFKEPFNSTHTIELLMNFACMFIWEICMAMPAKNVFRYIPPVLQTLITVFDFIAVVAGYVFNFYYTVRWWDSALHFLSGIVAVYFGYEITCALFKMEKRTAPFSLVLLTSVGFCVMCTTFWEIFEFSCDQVVGTLSGVPNDVQHWSFALAQGTPKEHTFIDPLVPERFAIMDTMFDIVLNTVGTILGIIGIKIYPYRHKGRFKFDFNYSLEESVPLYND